MSNSFAIETTGLTRHFEEVVAVDAVDLAVPRGSVYGFLGPNGAGKSTTIRMLLGLLRPSAGSISIFGRPFPRHRRTQLRRVGAMVEAPFVYQHLTGRENLVVTARLRGGIDAAMIDRALDCVDLLHAADRCVRAYSLGMTQRLGIALALLDDPDLLILDEPTNGLDPAGMHDIRTLIRNLPEQAGVTVFLSSHLLDEVERVASHVGVIRSGRLIFQGSADTLRNRRPAQVILKTNPLDMAARALTGAGMDVNREEETLRVSPGTESVAARCVAVLAAQDVDVFHVRVHRPSLEETFLALTDGVYPRRGSRQSEADS